MAAFEPFDLGKVYAAADSIKGARAERELDPIRKAFMQQQLTSAQQQQQYATEDRQVAMDERAAKRAYYTSTAALSSADIKGAVEALSPDTVQQWEQTHGQGSWKNLSNEQAALVAKQVQQHAIGIIGPQTKVKWIDSGGQQIAVDESTGQPIQGVAPIQKTPDPGAILGAETARLGQQVTVRGQDLSAATTRRGQDLAADTAAAGRQTTERGQDITAETARLNNPSSTQNADKTWNVYRQATSGLTSALGKTNTGPVGGRLPAITSAQQTAEGAVSAMAPVLKQLFRSAGEGTFTDRDQDLLLRMVPTRTDNPQARQDKLNNIDNIVRAKLGKQVPEARKALGGKNYLQIGGQWYEDDGS